MNFNICKKCLGYSLKNKIRIFSITESFNDFTKIKFIIKNRRMIPVSIYISSSDKNDNIFFNNDYFRPLSDTEYLFEVKNEYLKDIKIVKCSAKCKCLDKRDILHECPYKLEHELYDLNEKE